MAFFDDALVLTHYYRPAPLSTELHEILSTASLGVFQYVQYEMYSVQFAVCSMYFRLCSVQFVVYSVQYTVSSVLSEVCSIQYAVFSVQHTVCTV